MPAEQRGWVRKRKNGWQACWRDGSSQRTGPHLFDSKTEAKRWLSDNLQDGRFQEPIELRAEAVAAPPSAGISFSEHVERYLRVHGATVDPATIKTLRERLGATHEERRKRRSYQTPLDAFGHLTLAELEPMSLEIAEWQATLPPGYRYAIMRSLRQVLNAAVRWKLMQDNPANDAGANPQPRREEVSFFASLADVDKLAAELGPRFAPIVVFGVETGLRPSEWAALERRHLDRGAGVVQVRRSVVDGRIKEYGKTVRSRRNVPLTGRALAAVDALTARIDTPLLFPAPKGGFIDLDNWRRRDWRPALDAAGLDPALTPYAMRHTYASFALDAGVTIFELARLMGTSVKVIDDTYGHLVRGSFDRVRAALEARARRDVSDTDTSSGEAATT
jgi:integrase